MKILYSLFVLLFSCVAASSQVNVAAAAVRVSPGTYQLTVILKPQPGFHIYGNDKQAELSAPSIVFVGEKVVQDHVSIEGKTNQQSDPVFDNRVVAIFSNSVTIRSKVSISGQVPDSLNFTITGFGGSRDAFVPLEIPTEVFIPGGESAPASTLKIPTVDLKNPENPCSNEQPGTRSYAGIFLLGFLGGLVALFTPCVFPMVPVTVSFFANKSGTKKQGIRNGILYGGFILSIYLLASVPFHLVTNLRPELLNNIATSAPLNLLFFAVFLVFALSFFGLFDIRLPASIANRSDYKSGIGSITGIFFMALTLTIVSFSCTGPILGSLLVGSVSGGAWLLTSGLAGFGLALALPFAVFAIFPQLLKGLPKSGGWLDTVKKILAFIELALAFKFLSNADLVMHWGILKREVFIGIWILTGLSLGVYLLTIPVTKLSRRPIMIAACMVFLFCIYLVPGLTVTRYANLSLLSGIAPPLSYSVYQQSSRHLEPDVVNDYDKAIALAKKEKKKLLIDFTGWACVNCRKMEEQVWTKPEVSQYIRDNFILLSLYVDDKAKLKVQDQTRQLVTVGDKWASFQSQNFGQVTQPLYVILDEHERLMNAPVGYTPDSEKYLQWLSCGMAEK